MKNDSLRLAGTLAYEYMNKQEAKSLLRSILSGGARGLIKMAEYEANLDEAFMLLPPELKELAIGLVEAHKEAKNGASEYASGRNPQKPTVG